MEKQPVILFRKEFDTENELAIARQFFPVVEYRSEVPKDSLVIGRYSTLPYYAELEQDLRNVNSQLINSHRQHRWIADFDWYESLRAYTPETWFRAHELPDDDTQFIVKGKTNSRKFDWESLMFAKNKAEAIRIMIELTKDPLIGPQGIVFRRYIPLVTYEVGIKGLPFTNEWRFFFYKGEVISHAYYWSTAVDVERSLSTEGLAFAKQVAAIARRNCNFFVIDIAEKQSGGWTLIEINDAQSSGLSENNAEGLYRNLRTAILSAR